MSIDYGWNAHIDKTGSPCAYCGAPSTQTLVVEADEYKNHECVRRGKRVGTCDAHFREAEEKAPALSFRRRKDKTAEQLSMDVGDDHESRGNAIYGNDAA